MYEYEYVYLTESPANGYRFKEWQVIKGGVTMDGSTFEMLNEDVEIRAVFEPVYSIISDGSVNACAWFDLSLEIIHEAAEGEEIELVIPEDTLPDTGKYFTGEFLVDGESLGSDYNAGSPIYKFTFTMPAHEVTISAAQERKEELTVELGSGEKTELPEKAYMQINFTLSDEMSYNFENDWSELDLNKSGTADIAIITEFVDISDEATEIYFYAQLLPSADAIGIYQYDFTDNKDKYSSIFFNTSASALYSISIDTPAHGTVIADRILANKDDNVTLSVTPDKGYKLKTLSVIDDDDK